MMAITHEQNLHGHLLMGIQQPHFFFQTIVCLLPIDLSTLAHALVDRR